MTSATSSNENRGLGLAITKLLVVISGPASPFKERCIFSIRTI
jgi:hypothetical protein